MFDLLALACADPRTRRLVPMTEPWCAECAELAQRTRACRTGRSVLLLPDATQAWFTCWRVLIPYQVLFVVGLVVVSLTTRVGLLAGPEFPIGRRGTATLSDVAASEQLRS
jgi:hypothetical protein